MCCVDISGGGGEGIVQVERERESTRDETKEREKGRKKNKMQW